jgi:hypothetical protein
MFLTDAYIALASSCTEATTSTRTRIVDVSKFVKNDSITSVFVANGHKAICYDACFSGSSVVVKHPGSVNLAIYGMDNKTSSMAVVPDVVSPAEYASLQSTANMYRSQRDYANRRLNKVKKQLSDATQSVQDMN